MANEINARIKKYRKEKKFSQKKFVEILGCNYTTYSQREREGNFHAEEIVKIAEILDIDVRLLLYDKIPEVPQPPKAQPPTNVPTNPPKPLDKTFWVVDKLPRYKDPNIDGNASECIIGFRLIDEELSVMESNFIKVFRQIPKKDIKKLFQIMRQMEK